MYLVVSIGNTDNKLTQQEWSRFVHSVGELLQSYETHRHFFGGMSVGCALSIENSYQKSKIIFAYYANSTGKNRLSC